MKLWIISQDKKKFINTELLDIDVSNLGYCIMEYRYDLCLGRYQTEQRAKEIINEIYQKMYSISLTLNPYDLVYQMPKE